MRTTASPAQLRLIERMVKDVGGLRADGIYAQVAGRSRYALPYPARYQVLNRQQLDDLIKRLKEVTGR